MAERWRDGFQPDTDATGFLDSLFITGASIPVTTEEAVTESRSQMVRIVNGQPVTKTPIPSEGTVQIVRLPEEPVSGESLIAGVQTALADESFFHEDHVRAAIASSDFKERPPAVQRRRMLDRARTIMANTFGNREPLTLGERTQLNGKEAPLGVHVYIGLKKLNGKQP